MLHDRGISVGAPSPKVSVCIPTYNRAKYLPAALEVTNATKSYPAERYGSIGPLVDAVVPSVESLPDDQRTLPNCVAANARAQASKLAGTDPIIRPAVASGSLRVVAAVYEIESGRVVLL